MGSAYAVMLPGGPGRTVTLLPGHLFCPFRTGLISFI